MYERYRNTKNDFNCILTQVITQRCTAEIHEIEKKLKKLLTKGARYGKIIKPLAGGSF